VKIISVGDHCLTRDEYWRERKLSPELANMTVIPVQENAPLLAPRLRKELARAGVTLTQLTDPRTGRPAWGVEYRIVPFGRGKLVSMINLMPDPVTISLELPGSATDLVTGDAKGLRRLSLAPMEYILLNVK